MSEAASGGSDNSDPQELSAQKLGKIVKQLEKKLNNSETLRKQLEERYDNQSRIFDKAIEELDASRAVIGEQFRKIESILKNINQGIILVNGELGLGDQMSRALDGIIGSVVPANGHLVRDILDKMDISADDKSKIATIITVSIGEDELNYELNSDSMPRELYTHDKSRILEFDWNPTVNQGTVENFIVCIRDVTQIRALQEAAKNNAEHLNNIIEIVENEPSEVFRFIQRCKKMLEENSNIMNQAGAVKDRIEVMFRNAHTIKGGARIYKLSKIVNSVHELENIYQEIRTGNAQLEPSSIDGAFANCKQAIKVYEDILRDKLHIQDESNVESEADRLFELLGKLQAASETERSRLVDSLLHEYKLRSYHPLQRVLGTLTRGIPDIAVELNKPCPNLIFDDSAFMIHADISNLLVDAFTHLLRNSIDHGIESAENRIKSGKDRVGQIRILSTVGDSNFGILTLEDDGRGLNLGKLKSLSNRGNEMSDEEASEVIFQSGVSTAAKVTSISGRGVGMSAVREEIANIGGKVEIEFTAPAQPDGFRNFRFKISIPSKYLMATRKLV